MAGSDGMLRDRPCWKDREQFIAKKTELLQDMADGQKITLTREIRNMKVKLDIEGGKVNVLKKKIAHRSRGSAPRPAHSLRDTRPELLHVKELSAAPINDFGPQRPPECSEQHGYNAKFQQFPDI
ncbi:unnamed protein product [Pleuronectes platessa]|uniref:Uncharacterized protein n=1 Tax=Pleuronectes platessa TaxID=8262 RepID=A0A9N7VRQ3_PLEPL|nr:unnamed protein product [Pleuronectes platessa]